MFEFLYPTANKISSRLSIHIFILLLKQIKALTSKKDIYLCAKLLIRLCIFTTAMLCYGDAQDNKVVDTGSPNFFKAIFTQKIWDSRE